MMITTVRKVRKLFLLVLSMFLVMPFIPVSAGSQSADVDTHTVTFEVGDDTFVQTIDSNSLAYEPDIPEDLDDGRHFIGWFVKGTDELFSFDSTIIDKDITLQARFDYKFIVVFFDENDEILSYRLVDEHQTIDPLDSDVLTLGPDKLFAYWREKDKSESFNFSVAISKNTYLVPQLEKAKLVIFSSEGSQVKPYVIQPNKVVELPKEDEMVRPGYLFKHWSLTPNGPEYSPQVETESITLYAVWEAQTSTYSLVYWIEKKDIPIDSELSKPDDFEFYSITSASDTSTGQMTPISETTSLSYLASKDRKYLEDYFEFDSAENVAVSTMFLRCI